MNATALIADDEPQLARALQSQLAQLWPGLQIVALARNGLEAAEAIQRLQPTLAFLDIQMPGLTGLEVAQGIEGSTRVVFVTAYDQYAVQAFEAAALDYLLKPVGGPRLQRCVDRLRQALAAGARAGGDTDDDGNEGRSDSRKHDHHHGHHQGQHHEDDDGGRLARALQQLLARDAAVVAQPRLRWVRASAGDLVHQVPVEQVLFFRADDKYTCVQTAGAEYLIRTPISELAAQLDPERFVQVHRSTLVNLDHLAGTRRDDGSRLWLRLRQHGQELPVSRAYVHLFKAM